MKWEGEKNENYKIKWITDHNLKQSGKLSIDVSSRLFDLYTVPSLFFVQLER